MAVKPNKTLFHFASFLIWIEKLRGLEDGLWLKPIATDKWSIREILAHIMSWDRNCLEVMVPAMNEGAALSFVDIEQHNREAADWAQTYVSLDALLDDVVKMRRQLVEQLLVKYDDNVKFTIDNHGYTYKKFIHIFIHHDEHHSAQIDAFLNQELAAAQG